MQTITANHNFEKGYNCAQSVLHAYGKQHFALPESAYRLASVFGAGVLYQGGMCGAVSGALMAIGLHKGYGNPEDQNEKEDCYQYAREFIRRFEAQHGSTNCNILLSGNINTPEGLEELRQREVFKTICPCLVQSSAEIMGDLLK